MVNASINEGLYKSQTTTTTTTNDKQTAQRQQYWNEEMTKERGTWVTRIVYTSQLDVEISDVTGWR